MQQITQQIANWDSLSYDVLKSMREEFNQKTDANKQEKKDYRLSDEEVEYMYIMDFFLKKTKYANDSVKIGDVFHTSWGYDQTNVEFFQVKEISKTGKTCKVIQIGSSTVPGSEGFMSESCVPDPKVVIRTDACTVKIEKGTEYSHISKQREAIGEINLRGSVWFARGDNKHLQSLFRVEGQIGRSWYA